MSDGSIMALEFKGHKDEACTRDVKAIMLKLYEGPLFITILNEVCVCENSNDCAIFFLVKA
jgi:hypothetical protein